MTYDHPPGRPPHRPRPATAQPPPGGPPPSRSARSDAAWTLGTLLILCAISTFLIWFVISRTSDKPEQTQQMPTVPRWLVVMARSGAVGDSASFQPPDGPWTVRYSKPHCPDATITITVYDGPPTAANMVGILLSESGSPTGQLTTAGAAADRLRLEVITSCPEGLEWVVTVTAP